MMNVFGTGARVSNDDWMAKYYRRKALNEWENSYRIFRDLQSTLLSQEDGVRGLLGRALSLVDKDVPVRPGLTTLLEVGERMISNGTVELLRDWFVSGEYLLELYNVVVTCSLVLAFTEGGCPIRSTIDAGVVLSRFPQENRQCRRLRAHLKFLAGSSWFPQELAEEKEFVVMLAGVCEPAARQQ